MPKNNLLTKEDFEALLLWFSPDREEAGAKYEEIRNGLIRYFYYKGCAEAESLADETINRVAKKFSDFDIDNNHKHITYFYGFAANIYFEYRKNIEKKEVQFEQNIRYKTVNDDFSDEIKETKHRCLDECLQKLAPEEKNLAIQYFCKDKGEKIEHRRKLAEQLSLRMSALHVKIHRLKTVLRNCVENCLNEN